MARIINIKAMDLHKGDAVYLAPNGAGAILAGTVKTIESFGTAGMRELRLDVNGREKSIIVNAQDTLLGYRQES